MSLTSLFLLRQICREENRFFLLLSYYNTHHHTFEIHIYNQKKAQASIFSQYIVRRGHKINRLFFLVTELHQLNVDNFFFLLLSIVGKLNKNNLLFWWFNYWCVFFFFVFNWVMRRGDSVMWYVMRYLMYDSNNCELWVDRYGALHPAWIRVSVPRPLRSIGPQTNHNLYIFYY